MPNEELMIEILKSKGLKDSYIKEFLVKNPASQFSRYKVEEVKNKLSVIYNGDIVHGVLFCDGNSAYYSHLDNDSFGKLFYRNGNNEYLDYASKLIINNVYSTKFVKTAYGTKQEDDSLEKRIAVYRDVTKNSPGFKLK